MNERAHMLLGSLTFGLLIGAVLFGCKSTGIGTGESPAGDIKASFTWQQSEPTSGLLKATVIRPGAAPKEYEGKFYQITKDSRVETIAPLWNPWYPAWSGWQYWGPEPTDSFITHYTGHVVANLAGPAGERLRCHFRLLNSSKGMTGGGEGQCQLPSGETIKADFPPS